MSYADEQSYEEMISALQNYVSQIDEQCSAIESAGTDCVDNTDGDPAAVKSNEKLQKCVKDIRITSGTIRKIIAALQQEIDNIREDAAKADSI